MAIAIGLSAINALTLSPALCAVFLKPHTDETGKKLSLMDRFHKSFNAAYEVTLKRYKNGVLFFLNHKVSAFIAVAASVVILMWLVQTTPTGMVPNEDTGTFFVTVDMAPGTAQEKTMEAMMKVDSISAELARLPFGDAAFVKAKNDFAEMILRDPSSIVAYYTVNKIIGNRPLFSITDREDVRILGAVANAYNSYKPNDPRTELLKNMFFTGRRYTVRPAAPTDTFYVSESQIIDISLIDRNGKTRKLSEEASKGNVLILNFTTYLADESPALNARFAELYRKYSPSGFQIYQICYDANEFNWKTAAKSLPWITVYDPAGAQSENLLRYNVGSLPAIFIINRKGELSERVIDINDLEKAVAKYI